MRASSRRTEEVSAGDDTYKMDVFWTARNIGVYISFVNHLSKIRMTANVKTADTDGG